MHTEPHSTQETQPQIGDMLKRRCGTIAIVEEAHFDGVILQARIMHLPKDSRYIADDPIHIPAELIGVSWHVIA